MQRISTWAKGVQQDEAKSKPMAFVKTTPTARLTASWEDATMDIAATITAEAAAWIRKFTGNTMHSNSDNDTKLGTCMERRGQATGDVAMDGRDQWKETRAKN